jgi:hypothetical protein
MCVADFAPLSPLLHNLALIVIYITGTNMLLGVVVITCMVICKQSKCILIEITSRRVLTIIFYDQNTLGGAITHNMTKPFAAVTLDVSRSA